MTGRLVDGVRIASRFRRSVNLALDFDRVESIESYVVSPLARDTMRRIVDSLATEGGTRAWSLVGPYGGGKSSFAAFIASLLGSSDRRVAALGQVEAAFPGDLPTLEATLDQIGGELVPVLITGERVSPTEALLSGVHGAATRFWRGRGATPRVVQDLEDTISKLRAESSVSADLAVRLVCEVAEKIAQSNMHGRGLFIVLDEAGKLLEYAALHPHRADVYLFQVLAESLTRLDGAIGGVVTVLHQDFSQYAESLSRSERAEWSKVAGRYEPMAYLESAHHLVRLIAGAVQVDGSLSEQPLFERGRRAIHDLSEVLEEEDLPLEGCLPLHPVTAVCLGPVFRRRFAQNERSLFAFLASSEPFGFQAWLAQTSGENGERPFSVGRLFDYIVESLGGRERLWSSASYALERLPGDCEALDAEVVKAIAVLTAVRESTGLTTDVQTLAAATDAPVAAVEAALQRLSAASVVVFRRFKNAWLLWDGSDLDVDVVVKRARGRVAARGGFAALLQEALPPVPVVASRHAHRTGTLRTLMPRFVSEPGTHSPSAKGDGDLLIVVPDREDELPEFVALLRRGELAPLERPQVHVLPIHLDELREAILEYFAAHAALGETPELESDPVARKELEQRRLEAYDELVDALSRSYGAGAVWWTRRGQRIAGARASAVASDIMDEAYNLAPTIHNELVNRSSLSTSAAAARRTVMERMLTHSASDRLAIEAFPPELSVYMSVLKRSGLHRRVDGEWRLGAPESGSTLEPVWERIEGILRASGARRLRFSEVCEQLTKPPYGMRSGVSMILVWAWVLVRREQVFVYEDGTFMPSLGDDLVHRLIKKPDSVEVQAAFLNDSLHLAIRAIGRGCFGSRGERAAELNPLWVIRQLVRTVSRLTPYASGTSTVSLEARRVRTAVKSARDPVRLVMRDIPDALGLNPLDQAGSSLGSQVDALVDALRPALLELTRADEELADRIESSVFELLVGRPPDPEVRAELGGRARALEAAIDLPASSRRLVEVTTDLGADDESRRLWIAAVGTCVIGKSPDHWTDSDAKRFQMAAVEPCKGFLAAEHLAVEKRALGSEGSPSQLVRIALLQSSGEEAVSVGVLNAADREAAGRLTAQIVTAFGESGLSRPGLVYAVAEAMLQSINRTNVQED